MYSFSIFIEHWSVKIYKSLLCQTGSKKFKCTAIITTKLWPKTHFLHFSSSGKNIFELCRYEHEKSDFAQAARKISLSDQPLTYIWQHGQSFLYVEWQFSPPFEWLKDQMIIISGLLIIQRQSKLGAVWPCFFYHFLRQKLHWEIIFNQKSIKSLTVIINLSTFLSKITYFIQKYTLYVPVIKTHPTTLKAWTRKIVREINMTSFITYDKIPENENESTCTALVQNIASLSKLSY